MCIRSVPPTFQIRKGGWVGEHYRNSQASRPIHTNSGQFRGVTFAHVRLISSRNCERDTWGRREGEWALRLFLGTPVGAHRVLNLPSVCPPIDMTIDHDFRRL